MKKIHRSEFVNLPAVRLYRDDLEEIVALLSENRPARISDGDCEFDSLDELAKQRGATPSTLELHADFTSGVKIRRLRPSHLWGSESPNYLQIRDLLRKRRTFLAKVFVWETWLPLAVVLYVMDRVGRTLAVNPPISALVSGLSLAALLGVLASQLVQSGIGSAVNLTLRHETSTFWSRNGEKLVLALVSAILGVFAKVLYDLVTAYTRAH